MNDSSDFDLKGFARLVKALEPWLSEIVIIGGWAHRLFRYHRLAQPVSYDPLFTLDTDVAVPPDLKAGSENVGDRLRAAGFDEDLLGNEQPPAAHYRLGKEDGAFYAEFLSPLIGSEYDRDGNRRATSSVAGVNSQNLRYIDLLLRSPWTVELSAEEFPLESRKEVRIASPTHFMAQKLLIHDRRERRSRAKDILYLHDTIEIFGASLDVLNREWNTDGRSGLTARAIETVENAGDTLFGKVTDDARAAAQSAAGRNLSGETVQQLCRAGLKTVFAQS